MSTEKKAAAGRCITGILWFFSIIIFINAINFQHNPPQGWYQQFLPDIGNASILEIDFLDSLNGYVRTGANSAGVSYLLKTTTGGENWTIARLDSFSSSSGLMKFLNKDSGIIVVNRTIPFASDLFSTTDGGNSWDSLRRPVTFFEFQGISVVSMNEIWAVDDSPFSGTVWRSLDGGQSWQRMLAPLVTNNPDRIYMVNSMIGFVSKGNDINSNLLKTTDAGITWNSIANGKGWDDVDFRDSMTGWKAFQYDLLKTRDGGLGWDTLHRRTSGTIGVSPFTGITRFSLIDSNRIWGTSLISDFVYVNGKVCGVLMKTLGSENTWGYQIPDTSFSIRSFHLIDFPDSLHGSSFSKSRASIHTVTGGDSITNPITSINSVSDLPEKGFELHQNYPNPFNPTTTIRFDVRTAGNVSLKVYDVLGREVAVLADEYLRAGSYERVFNARLAGGQAAELTSGVYFYTLQFDGKQISAKGMALVK